MAEELKIREMIEKFSARFEETVFTLISKFNQIDDGFSRVQEAFDFLGKLQVQTAENKQIMTKVDQSFKNLERKLREMSEDGFVIHAEHPIEAKAKESTDTGSLFSAPAVERPAIETKEEVDAMKTVVEKTTIQNVETKSKEKLKVEEHPILAPAVNPIINPTAPINPVQNIKPISNPAPIIPPKANPIPIPSSNPIEEIKPIPEAKTILKPSLPINQPKQTESIKPLPETKTILKPSLPINQPKQTESIKSILETKTPLKPSIPTTQIKQAEVIKPTPESKIVLKPSIPTQELVLEQSPGLTPVPKFGAKGFLSPVPADPAKIKGTPAPVAPIAIEPKPVEKPGFTPMPSHPKSGAGAEAQLSVEAPPTPRVVEIRGVQDVWQNLSTDIKESETYEQAAQSLGFANENLKRFVRFHKVLFELLKLASDYRRKGGNNSIGSEEKDAIIKKIDAWKFELR